MKSSNKGCHYLGVLGEIAPLVLDNQYQVQNPVVKKTLYNLQIVSLSVGLTAVPFC